MVTTARSSTIRDNHRASIRRARPPCAICGNPIDYGLRVRNPDGTVNQDAFVVDHVVSLKRGGTDTLDNKQPAHWRCNRAKSDRADGGSILKRSGSLVGL